jgi:hypothetical protein
MYETEIINEIAKYFHISSCAVIIHDKFKQQIKVTSILQSEKLFTYLF